MKSTQISSRILFLNVIILSYTGGTSVWNLNYSNFGYVVNNTQFVLVNFYTDWCQFSRAVKPIFEEAAEIIKKDFTGKSVKFARVDGQQEKRLLVEYRVTKFPTFRLFEHGKALKYEYRGQRTVDGFVEFVKDQKRDSIIRVKDINMLSEIDRENGIMIGTFKSETNEDFKSFKVIADILKGDCKFHAVITGLSSNERFDGNHVIFRPSGRSKNSDILYPGLLNDQEMLTSWAYEKCSPAVRKLTFENAETIMEERRPCVILYRHPYDEDIEDRFREIVQKELIDQTSFFNFVIVDGQYFGYPLNRLGKKIEDMPLIAIDDLSHTFLYPQDVNKFIDQPGILKSFTNDYYSGKLHKEFHDGLNANNDDEIGPSHVEIQRQLILTPDGTPMTVYKMINVHDRQNLDLDVEDINHPYFEGDHWAEMAEKVKIIAEPHLATEDEASRKKSVVNVSDDHPLSGIANRINADNKDIVMNELGKHVTIHSDNSVLVHEETVKLLVKRPGSDDTLSKKNSSPPKSVLQNLGPSENRYSLLREEEL